MTVRVTPQDEASVAASRSRRDGALRFAATTTIGICALGTLAAVDPNEPGHYPTCPFLATTGYFCPGCGALRTVHALLHGDMIEALTRNPAVVLFAPLLALAWVRWGLDVVGLPLAARLPHPTRIPARYIWIALAAIFAFWIARNIPGWNWLSPA